MPEGIFLETATEGGPDEVLRLVAYAENNRQVRETRADRRKADTSWLVAMDLDEVDSVEKALQRIERPSPTVAAFRDCLLVYLQHKGRRR